MSWKKLSALFVFDGNRSFESLRGLLNSQGIEVWSSRTCKEAACVLDKTHPELIFTATQNTDGPWREIVILAEHASVPTNVIVLGDSKDARFYIAAMDYGAFDFILPPFESDPVGHVGRVAAENARRRREAHAIGTVA